MSKLTDKEFITNLINTYFKNPISGRDASINNAIINRLKDMVNKIEKTDALIKSGDLSDGYHSFNDLYYQRCILFASLVNQNKDRS